MRSLVAAALLLSLMACSPGRVVYGDMEPLPLVQPSSDKRRWYVVVDTGTQGEHLFFLDTGYSVTTCDDGFINKLGAEARGRVRVQGEAGVLLAERVVLPPLKMGGHTVEKLPCLVRDLHSTSSIQDPTEVPIAGVLGADVFAHFRVVIDPVLNTVELHPPSVLARTEHTVELPREHPFSTRRTLPIVINEQRIRPILDTGATSSHLDGAALGLMPTRVRTGATIRATGGDGTIVRDLAFYETDVIVGPHRLEGIELTGRDSSLLDHGLLGLNVLSNFRQDYDWKRGRVLLTPVEAQKVPSWREWKFGGPKAADVEVTDPAATP